GGGGEGEMVWRATSGGLLRGGFDCVSLGERRIRGQAQPIEIFRVQGVSAVRNPIEAAGTAGLTPLTGRDVEIRLLQDRWERAQAGAGQVVLLVGEPGLGKSRLGDTMKGALRGAPAPDPFLSNASGDGGDPPGIEVRGPRRRAH